ncbi:MAG TPA: hypothetical protein VH601_08525 [Bryobacteraceae bacterium]
MRHSTRERPGDCGSPPRAGTHDGDAVLAAQFARKFLMITIFFSLCVAFSYKLRH